MASLHMACIQETLMPLILTIQESPGNAGFSEVGILNVLKGAKVFKGGDTCDNGKKKA
jgi:hypothetical protein